MGLDHSLKRLILCSPFLCVGPVFTHKAPGEEVLSHGSIQERRGGESTARARTPFSPGLPGRFAPTWASRGAFLGVSLFLRSVSCCSPRGAGSDPSPGPGQGDSVREQPSLHSELRAAGTAPRLSSCWQTLFPGWEGAQPTCARLRPPPLQPQPSPGKPWRSASFIHRISVRQAPTGPRRQHE